MYSNEEEVRDALERKLGGPPGPNIWGFLIEDRYVEDVLAGEDSDLQGLVDRYWQLARWFSERQPVPQQKAERGEVPPDSRARLITKILAKEAAQLPQVERFRQKYLPDGLLGREEVKPWIEKWRQAEGEPTWRIDFPLPPGHRLDYIEHEIVPPVTLSKLPQDSTLRKHGLHWVDEYHIVRAFPVKIGGVLDNLMRVSLHLNHRYGWGEAAATHFVLTGDIPFASHLRYSIQRGDFVEPSGLVHRYAHIILEVDPAASPKLVESVYRRIRQSVWAGKRYKPLSAKITALVEFVLDHKDIPEQENGTWETLMKLWNKLFKDEHADWAYSDSTNFAKDYHRAVKKLFRPPAT